MLSFRTSFLTSPTDTLASWGHVCWRPQPLQCQMGESWCKNYWRPKRCHRHLLCHSESFTKTSTASTAFRTSLGSCESFGTDFKMNLHSQDLHGRSHRSLQAFQSSLNTTPFLWWTQSSRLSQDLEFARPRRTCHIWYLDVSRCISIDVSRCSYVFRMLDWLQDAGCEFSGEFWSRFSVAVQEVQLGPLNQSSIKLLNV